MEYNNVSIKKVIYSNPVTVILWSDNTKTISRCDDVDEYDELTGFMLCVWKKTTSAKEMRELFNKFVYNDDKKYVKRIEKDYDEDEKIIEIEFDGELDDKAILNLLTHIDELNDRGRYYVL